MKVHPLLFGIAAAVLFGSSTPISKLFLDRISPLQLAGTLYLGAGLCLLVYRGVRSLSGSGYTRPLLGRKGNLSLVGSIIFGGILAPISLLVGLSTSSAAETSLLLNFEAVATVLLAATVFREHIGKRTSLVVVLFTAGSIVLTIDPSERLMLSPGALLIILSCVFWGLDNNLSRNISGSDPTYVVMVKGLVAGTFSLALSLVLGHGIPSVLFLGLGSVLGGAAYGLSLVLYMLSLRKVGSARTGTLFAVSPFVGVVLSIAIFMDTPSLQFVISLPLMVVGLALLFRESHRHIHEHEELDHDHHHDHSDGHHGHEHGTEMGSHYHPHHHGRTIHSHSHMPDIHHRHKHRR